MRIAGVIPAKGSSSRVPAKNLERILGAPLFLWAANNLSRVLPREDIHIDSDSDEIRCLALRSGFSVITRPPELATNATDGNQLLLWETSQVDADVYVQHLPPMVFLRAETLRSALDAVIDGAASCFGVYKRHVYRWTHAGPEYDLDRIPNSFTLPPTIVEGMGLYAVRRDALMRERRRIVAPYRMLELDQYERLDIDDPEELEFARTVASGLGPDSPWTSGISDYPVSDASA